MKSATCVVCIAVLVSTAHAYLPIIAMHGFALNNDVGTNHDWDNITSWLQELHPGTQVFALKIFDGLGSTRPMPEQIEGISAMVNSIIAANASTFANGYHLLGHSQGGLMVRCLAEYMDDHRIVNLISLAGVQQGYYGLPPVIQKYFPGKTPEVVTDILYTSLWQDEFSVAGYWQSPLKRQDYLKHVRFLPVLDLLVDNVNATKWKANMLRVSKFALFGSPNDGDIVPWQSELFGFYEENSTTVLLPYDKTPLYVKDTFGLKSLDEAGKLFLHDVPGIQHSQWLHNRTNFVTHVLPYLT